MLKHDVKTSQNNDNICVQCGCGPSSDYVVMYYCWGHVDTDYNLTSVGNVGNL